MPDLFILIRRIDLIVAVPYSSRPSDNMAKTSGTNGAKGFEPLASPQGDLS
jgi:hypothetical protein